MKRDNVFGLSATMVLGWASLYACSHPEPAAGETPGGSPAATSATGAQGSGTSGSSAATGSGGGASSAATAAAGSMGGTGASSSAAAANTSEGAGGTVVVVSSGGAPQIDAQSCPDETYQDKFTPGYQISDDAVAEAQNVVSAMSTTEKAQQMRGTPHSNYSNWGDTFRTEDNPDKNIKGFWFRDGPRGVNLDAPYPDGNPRGYSTAFPVAIARGATFDLDLEYEIGVAIGDETLASGNTMQLSPTVNILRHPAWGRTQETYSEDPFHLGRLGAAFVAGVQEYIPACVKHYLGNNVEQDRESFDATMDAQTMREIYGYAYEKIIKDGGVACVMASYNLVNGVKNAENSELLTTMLRDEWGFQGMVLTDWWAMRGGSAPNSDDPADAQRAVTAGLDMELPWSLDFSHLESLVQSGGLSADDLTNATRQILEEKFRFNVDALDGNPDNGTLGLKPPSTGFDGQNITGNDAHIQLAERAARESMVLLQNDGTLPLAAGTGVAVISSTQTYQGNNASGVPGGTVNFATDVLTGDSGSSRVKHDPSQQVSIFDGIAAAAGGGSVTTGTGAGDVGDAAVAVVVVGRTPDEEGEEYTNAQEPDGDFRLGGNQDQLVQDVIALGKPTIVVMVGGSVIDMPWLGSVNSVVMAWYPGMVGGRALGQLLFGQANFSGKLPFTWPASWNDEPTFNAGGGVTMDYDLGYRHFDRQGLSPLFPFGHGESYTTFEYESVQLGCTDVTKNGVVPVAVTITNTGDVAGEETILVFTQYQSSSRATLNPAPIKELKAFQRVALDPGVTAQVTLPLRMSDVKYWDTSTNSWQVEPGDLTILVGPDAQNLPLSATLPVL